MQIDKYYIINIDHSFDLHDYYEQKNIYDVININNAIEIFFPVEDYKFVKKDKCLVYFEIYCEKEGKYYFNLFASGKFCRILFEGQYFETSDWIIKKIIFMKQGINRFFIQLDSLNIKNIVQAVILDYNNAFLNEDYKILEDETNIRKLYIESSKINIDNSKLLNFYINSDILVMTNNQYKCLIYEEQMNRFNGEIHLKYIDTINVVPFQDYTINMDKYCINSDTILLAIADNDYELNLNGKNAICYKRFYVESVEKCLFKIKEFIKYLFDLSKDKWYKKYIDNCLKSIENRNCDIITEYNLYAILYDYYISLSSHASEREYFNSPGYKEIYYTSKIDGNVYNFAFHTPNNIKNLKKVPMFIVLSKDNTKAYIKKIAAIIDTDYIVVEMSTRGTTFGNYFTEFSFFEVINKMKSLFENIIDNNVLLAGYSACASSALNLASRYPDIVTSCLAISGLSNDKIINNIRHSNIFLIAGTKDKSFNLYKDREKRLKRKNIKHIFIEGYEHALVTSLMSNKSLLHKFLSHKKIIKKDNYSYVTDSFYHNKIRIITILEPIDKNKISKIKVKRNGDKIIIDLINVKTFEINNDTCDLNEVFFYIKGKFINNLKLISGVNYFELENNVYISIYDYNKVKSNIHKLEILNIYLSSLFIYVNKEEECKLVKNFSKPRSMGTEKEIMVKYPICYFDNSFKILHHNYILYNYDVNQYMERINLNLVKCFDKYIVYSNEKIYGDYSVIQIMPNINDDYKFVLFINDNNKSINEKNFFIRNVIIQSDTSINKSLLTYTAIIYINNQYYAIKKYNDKIEKIVFS